MEKWYDRINWEDIDVGCISLIIVGTLCLCLLVTCGVIS